MVYFQHQIYIEKKEAALQKKKKKASRSKASLITVSFKLKGSQKRWAQNQCEKQITPLAE